MEVDQIENISHFDIVEVDGDRIFSSFGSDTVDDDMLVAMMDGKVVDEKTVLTVKNIRGLYAPFTVVEQYVRGHDAHVGLRLVSNIAIEADDGVEFSVHTLFGVMIIPFEGSREVIVAGISLKVDLQVVPVIHEFRQLEVALDGLCGRGHVDGSIRVPGTVIGKRGEVALEIDNPREVIDLCLK